MEPDSLRFLIELSNHNRDGCDVIKRSHNKNLHTPLHLSNEINSVRISRKHKWLCQTEQWAFRFTEIKWKELKPDKNELFLEWTFTVRTNWSYISKNTVWWKVTSICWTPPFWIFITSCDSPYFWGRSFNQNGKVQGFKNEGTQRLFPDFQNEPIYPKKSTSNSFRSKGPLEEIVFLSKYKKPSE